LRQKEPGTDGIDDSGDVAAVDAAAAAIVVPPVRSLLNCFGLLSDVNLLTSSSIKETGSIDKIAEEQLDIYASNRNSLLLKVM